MGVLNQAERDAKRADAIARDLDRRSPTPKSVGDLENVEFLPVRWAIPGLVPEGVNILAGPPKIGKSWFVLQLGAGAAAGERTLNYTTPKACDVLYLALEDSDARIKRRLDKLRAGAAFPRRLFYVTDWPRLNEGGLEALSDWLSNNQRAQLVIVDTLARLRPRRRKGDDIYETDYAVGEAFGELTKRHKVAILIVHHTRKSFSTDFVDDISGSLGLAGGVDAALVIRRERGKLDAVLHRTGREFEDESELALNFDRETARWSIIGSATEYGRTRERQEVIDAIRRGGEPLTARDIADRIDAAYETVRKTIARMVDAGELEAAGGDRRRGYTYQIPINNNTNYPK